MDFKLQTVTDFDFGVSPCLNDVVRVSEVPESVTNAEVNLILWLILEREFGTICDTPGRPPLAQVKTTQTDGGGDAFRKAVKDDADSDSVDSVSERRGSTGYSRRQRERRKSISQQQKARKYAEDLLRQAGVDLPFDRLSAAERRDLFSQFSASSELLRGNSFGSVLELFDALRTRSKLRSEFRMMHRLGRGSFGEVFAVSNLRSGTVYAAKKISLTIDGVEDIKMTLSESMLLKRLNHENIIRCHEAWLEMEYDPARRNVEEDDDEQEPLKFYVLMDHCVQSLSEWIQELKTKPDEASSLNIMKQIINGVDYIHSQGILHLDINTKNVLWANAEKTLLKIGDFGLAVNSAYFNGRSGTVPYSAPETFQTQKSDMYSVGVTVFETAESIQTYNELCSRLQNNDIKTGNATLDRVLCQLLTADPTQRPSASQAKRLLI